MLFSLLLFLTAFIPQLKSLLCLKLSTGFPLCLIQHTTSYSNSHRLIDDFTSVCLPLQYYLLASSRPTKRQSWSRESLGAGEPVWDYWRNLEEETVGLYWNHGNGDGMKGGNLKFTAYIGHWLEGKMKDTKNDFHSWKDV